MPIINNFYDIGVPTLWESFIALLPLTVFVLSVQIYTLWMEHDAKNFLIRNRKEGRKEFIDDSKTNEEFDKLLALAEKEVKDLIETLPDDVKKLAENTPCIFEPTLMKDGPGIDLGIYSPYWKSIVIYLGSISECCKSNTNLEMGQLIRKTYLHELAHRFGLNEKEVEERGLSGADITR